MELNQAKQLVAEIDGYNSFEAIPEHLILEYTERAYVLLISKMYSEDDVLDKLIEYNEYLWEDRCVRSNESLRTWFIYNKK